MSVSLSQLRARVARLEHLLKAGNKKLGGPMADQTPETLPPEAVVVSNTDNLPNVPVPQEAFKAEELKKVVRRIVQNTRSFDPPNIPPKLSDKARQLYNAEKALGSFDPKLKAALEVLIGESIPWESNKSSKRFLSYTMLTVVGRHNPHDYKVGEPCLVTNGKTDRALKMNGTVGNHLEFHSGNAQDVRPATNEEIQQFVIQLVKNGGMELLLEGANRVQQYEGDAPVDEDDDDDEDETDQPQG
jgi:hypothetical protein